MDIAGAGAELGVFADAVVADIAGARGGVQVSVSGCLNLIIDADVVQVFMARANAHDVSGLLDGRIVGDLLNLTLVGAPAGLDPSEDVNLAVGAVGDMDVTRASGHGKLDFSVQVEVALEGGFGGVDGRGCESCCTCEQCCSNEKTVHGIPLQNL